MFRDIQSRYLTYSNTSCISLSSIIGNTIFPWIITLEELTSGARHLAHSGDNFPIYS